MLLSREAASHLMKLTGDFQAGAIAIVQSGAPGASLLFVLSATEFLSLYYGGSRRPAGARGTRNFNRFLCRFFPHFNRDARDADGHFLRIRIPLVREGGKAHKRLKLPSALIHLFHRGVLEDLVAASECRSRCVLISSGRWGFQIHVETFVEDFLETLEQYARLCRADPHLARQFERRFQYLHGWRKI